MSRGLTPCQTEPSNDVPITNRPSQIYRLSFIGQFTQHATLSDMHESQPNKEDEDNHCEYNLEHNLPYIQILNQASEILMQCWALLIYGGVHSVSLSFVVANEPRFVQSFAVIVGLNCIVTGILWILYVTKIKVLNAIFHGTSFQSIAFVVDMVLVFLYTMFPFTLHSQNSLLFFTFKALATLHSENKILFLAAFIAMPMLFQKCMTELWSLDPVQIQKRALKIIKHHIDLVPLQPTYVPPTSSDSSL
eukprot:929207_1